MAERVRVAVRRIRREAAEQPVVDRDVDDAADKHDLQRREPPNPRLRRRSQWASDSATTAAGSTSFRASHGSAAISSAAPKVGREPRPDADPQRHQRRPRQQRRRRPARARSSSKRRPPRGEPADQRRARRPRLGNQRAGERAASAKPSATSARRRARPDGAAQRVGGRDQQRKATPGGSTSRPLVSPAEGRSGAPPHFVHTRPGIRREDRRPVGNDRLRHHQHVRLVARVAPRGRREHPSVAA